MEQFDVAVIGGGPAGMAAAVELAAYDIRFVVIDAYPRPGGHYFKQPPRTFSDATRRTDARQAEYDSLVASLKQLQVTILGETSVWSIFSEAPTGGYTLHLQGPHDVSSLHARYLLLAPGAYDRPLVFPGWHLGGVITPGGAQMLLKGHGIRPGRRALVAGSGPLLLAAAAGLAEAGTDVVAVLDVAPMRRGLSNVPQAFWGQKKRFKEAWHYMTTLKRYHVPLRFGHTVFRVIGDDEVALVTYGRVDAQGRPLLATEEVVEVDTVCAGLGFLPNLALTRYLGCEHVYDETLDAFYPKHTELMETTVPNVYVAGDVTGVGGKDMALLQGKVAGLAILSKLGCVSSEEVREQVGVLEPALNRETRFIHMLRDRLRLRPGLMELIDDETVVCRCEMVRAKEIKRAITEGGRDIRGLKLRTRCGMGPCQGRYCEATVINLIAGKTGQPRDQVGTMSVRPPLIPVPLGSIVDSS